MSKKICILVILFFSLVLTACNTVDDGIKTGEKDLTLKTDGQTSKETEQNNNISDDSSTKESDISTEKSYEVVDTRYNDNGININYPQIINLNDNDKQEKINEIIKSEALTALVFYKDSDGKYLTDGASLEINYKITLESKSILSLEFDGIENDKGSHYPIRRLYTLNLNMGKGSKLKLKDFINIDENLVDKFKQYKVSEPEKNQASAAAFDSILRRYSTEYLLECFEAADSSYENTPYTFSYLTKDALVISTEVTHNVGDHVEIKLKYEDIKDNIKSDNEIWKDLLNSRNQ